jgi:cell division protein FtsB
LRTKQGEIEAVPRAVASPEKQPQLAVGTVLRFSRRIKTMGMRGATNPRVPLNPKKKGTRNMRRSIIAASVFVLFLGLGLSGCVSTQKYNDLLSQKESLSMDKDKLATQNEDLKAIVAGLEKERDTLADQVAVLKDQLKEAEGKTATAQVESRSLQTQITEKNNQISALNAQIEKLNAEIEKLKAENQDLKSKVAPAPKTE